VPADGGRPANDQSAEPAAPGAESAPASERGDATALRKERDLMKEQLARALADMQNLRRRQAKEADDVRTRAVESLARELLPVLDNFQLAMAAHDRQSTGESAATQSLVEGLQMVRALLEGALERHGLREIAAVGAPFDPSQHEAVGLAPGGKHPPGTVGEVLQRGYALGDKGRRASKVLVAPDPKANARPGGGKDTGNDDASGRTSEGND